MWLFVLPSHSLCSCCRPNLSSWARVGDRSSGWGKPTKQLNAALPSPVSNEDPTPSPRVRPTTSSGPLVSCEPIPAVQVLERIPIAARHQCHLKLTTILEAVDAWNQLFHFLTRCIWMPARSRGRISASLAIRVTEQVRLEEGPPLRNQERETG